MTTKQIPSYFGGWLNYWNNSCYEGTTIRQTSGVGFGRDTLQDTQKELDFYLDYYANQLSYEIQDFKIAQYCSNCNASGQVKAGKRYGQYKPCPACKGKPELEVIVEWKHWREIRDVKRERVREL
jgi:O-succinylbenzoate synthase